MYLPQQQRGTHRGVGGHGYKLLHLRTEALLRVPRPRSHSEMRPLNRFRPRKIGAGQTTEEYGSQEDKRFVAEQGCEWKFNPPHASCLALRRSMGETDQHDLEPRHKNLKLHISGLQVPTNAPFVAASRDNLMTCSCCEKIRVYKMVGGRCIFWKNVSNKNKSNNASSKSRGNRKTNILGSCKRSSRSD